MGGVGRRRKGEKCVVWHGVVEREKEKEREIKKRGREREGEKMPPCLTKGE